jgi:hypothetical protein
VIADDISLDDSSLPENFESDNPGLKYKQPKEGYTVYGAKFCRLLACSAQRGDALRNADSITGIVLALNHIWETRRKLGLTTKTTTTTMTTTTATTTTTKRKREE